ncbi:hypothetical protein TU94_03340 [Streptomyces cyaneogriseus subsp. noncyanogenus]|uniref:Pyridine nucleotide-disulfide oxidoreductase n=1 Tax=Streptomyces cyaneogriseus subsp. noncyanogenus TaxID=477245 RepID=A0A0C5FSN1_9ACTN|nr:hypothetical protein [Streptomyces cyaneogriseus]AJP00673.1 hypothetical protein TU94_03340 [Streptomyces cyaneogriseus subsp. noncyanogenus]
MMIDEALVRELLEAPRDDTALILLEGRAQVVERAALDSDRYRGAAVVLSRGDLVDRLGTPTPSPEDLTRLAATLRDTVAKLGA